MLIYCARRLWDAGLTLFLLLSLTFFLLRLAPGGPFDGDRAWPPEIQANIARKYELDRPVALQFAHWLRDLSQGDLRDSFQYIGRPVTEIIGESLPISVELGAASLLLSVVLGIPLGCLAASRPGSLFDYSAMFCAMAGISLPSYLLASLLILVFSNWLGLLPAALWEGPSSAILPVLTLASRPVAVVARLTRASMLESLSADYIRVARAKGLPDSTVLFKHALKNSLVPVITVMGPLTASVLTGSFLVETVFQIPGLGKHFVHAVLNRDYPLVMGVTLVYGVFLLASNLGVDLLCAWADPRIRLGDEPGKTDPRL